MEFRSQVCLLLWVMLSWICTDLLKAAKPFGARIQPLLRLSDHNCTACSKPSAVPTIFQVRNTYNQSNYVNNATLQLRPNFPYVNQNYSATNRAVPEFSQLHTRNKNVHMNNKHLWNATQPHGRQKFHYTTFIQGKYENPTSELKSESPVRSRQSVQKNIEHQHWNPTYENGVPRKNPNISQSYGNHLSPVTKKGHSNYRFDTDLPKDSGQDNKLQWLWNITHSVNNNIPPYSIENPLVKTEQTASPLFTGLHDERYKKGATFFFTHVEPHRFEYRAMFQHKRQNNFEPFVQHFDHFPPLPKFPAFPEFPEIFPHNEPHFPKLSDFPDFSFPTLPPVVLKRTWKPSPESQTQRPVIDEKLDGPLKKYDLVLGNVNYPKIFRFNEERINIEDFDRQKKSRIKLAKSHHNELLEPENVKRGQLLILHGGIFTVKEPPLYNRFHARKIRKFNSMQKTFS